jgi:hypothetical protein
MATHRQIKFDPLRRGHAIFTRPSRRLDIRVAYLPIDRRARAETRQERVGRGLIPVRVYLGFSAAS